MHVVECVQYLLNQILCMDFGNRTILCFCLLDQIIKECAIGYKLTNNVIILLIVQQFINLHDSWMRELLEQLHFTLQVLLLALRLDVFFPDELDGTVNLGVQMECFSHCSKRSLTEHLINSVPFFYIRNLLESDELFEGHNMFVPLLQIHCHCLMVQINWKRDGSVQFLIRTWTFFTFISIKCVECFDEVFNLMGQSSPALLFLIFLLHLFFLLLNIIDSL